MYISLVLFSNKPDYVPKPPHLSELDLVFDTSYTDIQPYLFKVTNEEKIVPLVTLFGFVSDPFQWFTNDCQSHEDNVQRSIQYCFMKKQCSSRLNDSSLWRKRSKFLLCPISYSFLPCVYMISLRIYILNIYIYIYVLCNFHFPIRTHFL